VQWDDYTPATKRGDMATLRVSRSIWGKHINDPKTAKSKAPVPVIGSLAGRLEAYRATCGDPISGPIFSNSFGRPLDIDGLHQRVVKGILAGAGIEWHGWHGFRRGLATNLHRLGVDDKTIQAILRHSNVSVTQNVYIKTVPADAVLAMKRLEHVLMFPNCSPGERYGTA
jgi:integrase